MAKKPLIQILHDQTIVKIDTSEVHGFEQESIGFCYLVTATGTYTLNGAEHHIHDENINMGTRESLKPIVNDIMKLLGPYRVIKVNLPQDIDFVDDIEEFVTSREKLEEYIKYRIDFGQVAELIFKDGQFMFVEISVNSDNYKIDS